MKRHHTILPLVWCLAAVPFPGQAQQGTPARASPPHHIAVNDACDFVSEVFGATMLNVSALFKADTAIQAHGVGLGAKHFSPADLSSVGMDPHGGVSETSGLLAIRPDLVRSNYRTLPSYRAVNPAEMREIALRPGWRGYFSSPALANASYGRAIEMWWVEGMTDLILRAVRGENILGRPRWPGDLRNDPVRRQIVEEVLQSETRLRTEARALAGPASGYSVSTCCPT